MEVLGVPSDLGTCPVPTPALLGAATSSTRGNASCDRVLALVVCMVARQ